MYCIRNVECVTLMIIICNRSLQLLLIKIIRIGEFKFKVKIQCCFHLFISEYDVFAVPPQDESTQLQIKRYFQSTAYFFKLF